MTFPRFTLIVTVAVLFIHVTGCSVLKPQADLTQFYVLRSQPAAKGASVDRASLQIRVGPGRVATYLEKTPIVVEQGPNRVEYLDLYRWAELPSKGISRVLSENLATRLNGASLTVYPDPAPFAEGYELRYAVERFEGTVSGPVTLEVSWQWVQRQSSAVVANKRSTYTIPSQKASNEVSAYVNRLSTAVAQWADEVAAAIPKS